MMIHQPYELKEVKAKKSLVVDNSKTLLTTKNNTNVKERGQ